MLHFIYIFSIGCVTIRFILSIECVFVYTLMSICVCWFDEQQEQVQLIYTRPCYLILLQCCMYIIKTWFAFCLCLPSSVYIRLGGIWHSEWNVSCCCLFSEQTTAGGDVYFSSSATSCALFSCSSNSNTSINRRTMLILIVVSYSCWWWLNNMQVYQKLVLLPS